MMAVVWMRLKRVSAELPAWACCNALQSQPLSHWVLPLPLTYSLFYFVIERKEFDDLIFLVGLQIKSPSSRMKP